MKKFIQKVYGVIKCIIKRACIEIMKKIELQFQESGIKKTIELFNIILEESEYNLNQFVKSDSLSISDEMSVSITESLKEFVVMVPDSNKWRTQKVFGAFLKI